MDYYKILEKHDEFEKNSTVLSAKEDVKVRRTYIEDEDVTLNNDEKTETVERLVEGKLAEDVRKRAKAAPDAPVLITEVEGLYWLSEVTADNFYNTTIRVGNVEKKFHLDGAHLNFEALLNWLDEDPETPIGDEVS
jgi:hypothetical protein